MNEKINVSLISKIAHIIGQYYTFLKELNVFTDAQILYITFLIILLPYSKDEENLFKEIKRWFNISSNGRINYKGEIFELINDKDDIDIKSNLFLLTLTHQAILSFFDKTNMAEYFNTFKEIQMGYTKRDVYFSLKNGLDDTESIYFSMSTDQMKNNLINFFAIEKYAKEVYNFKRIINLGYNHEFTKYVMYRSKSDFLKEEQLKEKNQICALCKNSINAKNLDNYQYLDVINDGKTPYRQTDLFSTSEEVSFKNNHFICFDCTINRFAQIQLLIDDGILTESYIKELVKEDIVYKLYDIIFKNSISKYMPMSFQERKKFILTQKVNIFKDVYF